MPETAKYWLWEVTVLISIPVWAKRTVVGDRHGIAGCQTEAVGGVLTDEDGRLAGNRVPAGHCFPRQGGGLLLAFGIDADEGDRLDHRAMPENDRQLPPDQDVLHPRHRQAGHVCLADAAGGDMAGEQAGGVADHGVIGAHGLGREEDERRHGGDDHEREDRGGPPGAPQGHRRDLQQEGIRHRAVGIRFS